MPNATQNIVGLVPPVIATGLVLKTMDLTLNDSKKRSKKKLKKVI